MNAIAAGKTMEDREAALLAASRSGDEAAFRALFVAHHEAIHRAALAVTLDLDAAADVVQEVFVKLHTHPPTALRGPLRGWLLRVAMNEALGWRRRLTTWRRLSTPGRGGESAEGQLGRAQLTAQLRSAMGQLSARERAVLALHFDADLAPSELAAPLGLTANHARVLLHRALARLRAEAQRLGLEFPVDDPRLTAAEPPEPR